MKYILVFILLASFVAAEPLYLLTIEDGKVVDKQLIDGYAPDSIGEGVYELRSGKDTLSKGSFVVPKELIMEKFHEDGTIEGEYIEYEGAYTVLVPANEEADDVVLKDGDKEIATVDVTKLTVEGSSKSTEFFLRYEWLFIILKWILILIAAIVGIRYGIKKLRGKNK